MRQGRITETHSDEKGYQLVNGKLHAPYLNTRTRAPTPHPGNRVPTVWDYQIEEQDTDDEPLSVEQLAIHTPPDSPTLGQKRTTQGCQTWDDYCEEQITETGKIPWLSMDWDVYPNLAEYKKYLKTLPSHDYYKALVAPRQKLQDRQTRVYWNDGQALLITDETPH